MSNRTDTSTLRLVIDGQQVNNSFQELQKTSRGLQKEIKGLEVGSAEYIKKSQQLNQVNKRMDEVKTSIKAAGDEWKKTTDNFKKGVNDGINSLTIFGTNIGGLRSSFSQVTGSTVGFIRQLGVMKSAIIATGIGALVVAVASLIQYFKRSQDGINTWNKITAQAGAVVDVLLDRLVVLGKAILQFASGEYAAAWETAKNAFKGIGDEIQREVKLSGELSDAFAALAVKDALFISTRAERMKQVKELNFIAEDTAQSIEKRLAAAADAIAVEQLNMSEELALQSERVRLMALEYDRAESTTEDLVALEQEKARLFDLQTASLERQTTINNKLNILIAQQQKSATSFVATLLPQLGEESALEEAYNNVIQKYKDLQFAITATQEQSTAERFANQQEELQANADHFAAMSAHATAWGQVTTNLNNLIGGQSAALLGFTKIATGAQLSFDTVAAISSGVKAAMAAGPFPANLLALAPTLSAVFGNLAAARKLLGGTSVPDAPSFADGGYTGTGSMGLGRNRGGNIRGVVEEGEYVINRRMLNTDPAVANLVPFLEARRTGQSSNSAGASVPLVSSSNKDLLEAAALIREAAAVLISTPLETYFRPNAYSNAKEYNDAKETNRNRGRISA